MTEKDGYPLPLINDTLRDIASAKYVSKVDVISAFHRLRLKEGHESLTAFRTHYGAYEWLVTPFGLCGAPASFQRFINHVLGDLLDTICTVYLDDILIFLEDPLEHEAHVAVVVKRLKENALYCDVKKSEFVVREVKFLGFIVTTSGL